MTQCLRPRESIQTAANVDDVQGALRSRLLFRLRPHCYEKHIPVLCPRFPARLSESLDLDGATRSTALRAIHKEHCRLYLHRDDGAGLHDRHLLRAISYRMYVFDRVRKCAAPIVRHGKTPYLVAERASSRQLAA
jgi:hypothetical protein